MPHHAVAVKSRDPVHAICAEFDIEVVPSNVFPMPGQTRAVETIRQILDKRGEEHMRLVLTTLSETRGNNALIDRHTLWAVSDLVEACPKWVEERTSEWLEWWDRIPLGPILATVNELRGSVKQRSAIAGAIYFLLSQYSNESMSDRECSSIVARKVPRFGHSTLADEVVGIGERLLQVKAELPHGHFLPWVDEQPGMSRGKANDMMRVAKFFRGKRAILQFITAGAAISIARAGYASDVMASIEEKAASGFLITKRYLTTMGSGTATTVFRPTQPPQREETASDAPKATASAPGRPRAFREAA